MVELNLLKALVELKAKVELEIAGLCPTIRIRPRTHRHKHRHRHKDNMHRHAYVRLKVRGPGNPV